MPLNESCRDEIRKAKQEAKASARAQTRAEKCVEILLQSLQQHIPHHISSDSLALFNACFREMAKEAKVLKRLKEKELKALEKQKEKDENKRKKLEIQAANGKFYDEEIVCIMDKDLALRCPSLLQGSASQDGCTEKFEVRPSKEEEDMVPYSGIMVNILYCSIDS